MAALFFYRCTVQSPSLDRCPINCSSFGRAVWLSRSCPCPCRGGRRLGAVWGWRAWWSWLGPILWGPFVAPLPWASARIRKSLWLLSQLHSGTTLSLPATGWSLSNRVPAPWCCWDRRRVLLDFSQPCSPQGAPLPGSRRKDWGGLAEGWSPSPTTASCAATCATTATSEVSHGRGGDLAAGMRPLRLPPRPLWLQQCSPQGQKAGGQKSPMSPGVPSEQHPTEATGTGSTDPGYLRGPRQELSCE